MVYKNKINITTIWWWNWSYWLLTAIKDNKEYNISAIISMSDSWWSTGILRKEFGILPPWDVRRALIALSSEHEIIKNLFWFRFKKDSIISWHSLWNLIITAMTEITGNFDKWLKQLAKLLKVKWRVIPVTLESSDLNVELKNWEIIEWETKIDLDLDSKSSPIINAYLTPEVSANPKAIKAIYKSDVIIISFWDLYTSVIPNLLVKWIKEAILKNKDAKVIYFCNAMSKPWETTWFEAINFIDTVEKYLWEWIIDYFIVNNWYISEKMADKYKNLENKKPIKIKDKNAFVWKKYKVIEEDLLYENDFILYHYKKIDKVIKDIIKQ